MATWISNPNRPQSGGSSAGAAISGRASPLICGSAGFRTICEWRPLGKVLSGRCGGARGSWELSRTMRFAVAGRDQVARDEIERGSEVVIPVTGNSREVFGGCCPRWLPTRRVKRRPTSYVCAAVQTLLT